MSVLAEEKKIPILLDDDQWKKFQEALDQPAEIKPGLQKLMKERAPWE